MNKVILMGRLTRKPEISWNEEDLCIARFTLAVDRRFKREGQQDADFIGCVAFGKNAEFADKYLNQGTKIALEGRIQTGNGRNKSIHDRDCGGEHGICRKEGTMIEGIKKIREAFRKITAGLRKDGTINARPGYESYIKEKLKEKEEVPGKAIMFVDGEKNAELTQIKKAALKTGEAENVWAVCGIRGKIHPKVVEIKLCANRKQKRKLHNKGNNKRKMNGQPLKRFIAKQKVRKRKVSESDTMK